LFPKPWARGELIDTFTPWLQRNFTETSLKLH
jgi:hypothetical protein